VIIKMNTGDGKAVVGLIALKLALNERVGPAAYITPEVHLAGQVRAEAEGLGLETTSDPDSARFRQGHAILIANVYKLFNGLFGVKGSARTMVELGTVLVDDAHACLATVEELGRGVEDAYVEDAYVEVVALRLKLALAVGRDSGTSAGEFVSGERLGAGEHLIDLAHRLGGIRV
jgi:hypothetical protein